MELFNFYQLFSSINPISVNEVLLFQGSFTTTPRVTKSELDAILNMLDAETDRIIEDYGTGVLYGGLQETNEVEIEVPKVN